jgi:hypothetical protein
MIPAWKRGSVFALIAASLLLLLARASAVRADGASDDLAGVWKLVVLAFGDDEYAVIRIDRDAGKDRAFVMNAQTSVLGLADNLAVESLVIEGGSMSFALRGPSGESRFQGKLADAGPAAGKIQGSFLYRNEVYPARLERAGDGRLADRRTSPLIRTLTASAQNPDPAAKIAGLRQGLRRYKGNPTNYLFYGEILATAAAAEMPAEEVGALVDEMIKEARPYGEAWVQEIRIKALKVLAMARPYADISLALAREADRSLGKDDRIEQQAAVVGMLARAAELAGKPDIAQYAAARSAKIEEQLDEEYSKTVPPFHPEPFKGRKDPKADRVVVMELFSGAQCIPCIATDVAFDALLKTYKPTEFIGLQHHLHVPGFDALTNKDTDARREYYGEEIAGTPAVFLSGHALAPGGGPMSDAEKMYKEYRSLIDPQLESAREANITLSARRAGDQVDISAEATVTPDGKDKNGEAAAPRTKLRLVLTERSVRYVGKNKLRLHHNVVRSFPGGLDGKELSAGQGRLQVKLSLAEVRSNIERYLSDLMKEHSFQAPVPPIPLEDLSVVAFVQDDATRTILHAVSVPVVESRP